MTKFIWKALSLTCICAVFMVIGATDTFCDIECAPECPDFWIGDGICDPDCYVDACSYDGGDCECAPGCPDFFIGDGFCDDACDVDACSYDGGDCDENAPPVALCKNVTVSAGPDCSADASVDDGSYDPDGDTITLVQTPPGPYELGDTGVTLTVDDPYGGTASCAGVVTVVDTTPPEIECNAPAKITPADAPVSFTSTVTDNCDGDETTVEITDYDCFNFTKKGRGIDKTESCIVSLEGDTINIIDSGGVGDIISWTAISTDDYGNTTELECTIVVVRKMKP